jgi:tetratricopeptide (TPR) repeat protein
VRQELQDVYEAALPRLHELDTASRFDEAQRVLDDLLAAHAPRDGSDWLRRSVLAHKAMLYMAEGVHGRAVSTYQELKRLGFTQPSERVEYGLGLSRALLACGRPQEAVAAVEETLEALEPSVLPSGVPLLEALAVSYTDLGASMPERWRNTVWAAATAAGIQLPERASDMALNELALYAAAELRSRSARNS